MIISENRRLLGSSHAKKFAIFERTYTHTHIYTHKEFILLLLGKKKAQEFLCENLLGTIVNFLPDFVGCCHGESV
jgi:hypothetical protein